MGNLVLANQSHRAATTMATNPDEDTEGESVLIGDDETPTNLLAEGHFRAGSKKNAEIKRKKTKSPPSKHISTKL